MKKNIYWLLMLVVFSRSDQLNFHFLSLRMRTKREREDDEDEDEDEERRTHTIVVAHSSLFYFDCLYVRWNEWKKKTEENVNVDP